MHRAIMLGLLLLSLSACGPDADRAARGSGKPLPPTGAPIPRTAGPLAARLSDTTIALHAAVDRWRFHGRPDRGSTPRDVSAYALLQQRLYLHLGGRPRLAANVRRRLRGPARAEAGDLVAARQALERLNGTTRRVRFKTGRTLPPDVLRRYYRRAGRRFGVPWEVLASVNFVETGFNKIRSRSSAGAQGPMQFIPSTWRAYGMGGDIRDPRDAIMGAANYLRASGARRDVGRALYAYNPSSLYVRAVSRFARRIRARPQAFYALHSWEIFVRTPSGPRRLTGPDR
ncbi:MAG: lytic murein transglycosylase [Thermoleophilaceae bacterium]